jgi:hypothetical protein
MSTTAVQKLYDVCKATFSASSGVPSAAALERVRLALGMSYIHRVLWTSFPPTPSVSLAAVVSTVVCLFVCFCCRECHCFGVFFWCSIFILGFLALTSV